MFHLIMTHSPRLTAMSTNKRLGEDVVSNPDLVHRLSWLQEHRDRALPTHTQSIDQALCERIA